MIYSVIGLMSGSSLDGLDIVFAEIEEQRGKWSYRILNADCYTYEEAWKQRLQNATSLSAYDYCLLDADYGRYLGEAVNRFINTHQLQHKIQLVSSHGHTTFHSPGKGMTHQIGDGAAIAATTGINVVSNLRSMDVALGGQGAPIVPVGEKLLFSGYELFLNIGGIANISLSNNNIAFDVCPANKVLNLLANKKGLDFDEAGAMASSGEIHHPLLAKLNALEYYQLPHPKSLANSFGASTVMGIIEESGAAVEDALMTYCEHICMQTERAIESLGMPEGKLASMLVTGGGAFNNYLIERLRQHMQFINVDVVVPEAETVAYKEAIVMALLGVLRWREQTTVLHTVTGARRDSIGGCVWMGQEA